MTTHLVDLPLKPAVDKRHDHDRKLARAIADASAHVMKVNAVAGGRVILQDLAGNVYDEPYCRLGTAVFAAGDLVLVDEIRTWSPDVSPSDMGGTRIVIDRVMTDPPPETVDMVSKLLLHDLNDAGVVENEIITFDGSVWTHAMNREMRFTAGKQDAADTSPITASATFQNAMTINWGLPSGTWTIEADGFLDVIRASTLRVNLRLTINGTVDSSPSTCTVDTGVYASKGTNFLLTGVPGGTIPVVLQYKGDSGSGITTTAEAPRIILKAIRTA